MVLLAVLATVSLATGNTRAAAVITVMIVLGVGLRFVQEGRADRAAARLKALIRVTATVVRDGQPRKLPLEDLVPGDVVQLAAGDMIPADLRLVACKDLHVFEARLTGEAFPTEKTDQRDDTTRPLLERRNLCFLGTSVERGTARGVVVAIGRDTVLGGLAQAVKQAPTSFDMTRFTWLMIRFMLVLVPLVFVLNGVTKGDWGEAFFFAVAVAVGLTPEMLPGTYWPFLAATLVGCLMLTQAVKTWLLRRNWV